METRKVSCLTVEESKRKSMVPNEQETLNGLELMLAIDTRLTGLLAMCSSPSTRYGRLFQKLCFTLELSGHGVPWFLFSGILIVCSLFYSDERFIWVYGYDLLAILLLDLALVAPLKLIFKRPRPPVNEGAVLLSVSAVDSYAFPSGHASRAVAIAAFFCYMPPFHIWTHLWYIWAAVVSVSRIMLGRHHILDVLAGVIAGLAIFETARQTCLIS